MKYVETFRFHVSKLQESDQVFSKNDKKLDLFLKTLSMKHNLEVNPFLPQEFIYDDKVSLEFNRFNKGNRDEIVLQDISVYDKNKGVGSDVMKDIVDVADKLKYKITLEASPFGSGGLKIRKLVEFYEKFGFEVDLSGYGGQFKTRDAMVKYAEKNKDSVPMFRNPK